MKTRVMTWAARTIIMPIFDRELAVESALATKIKISQATDSDRPPKAERAAQTIVDWKLSLEAKVTQESTTKPRVTGTGINLEELIVLVLLVSLPELLTQKPLSSIEGGVQLATHFPLCT